MFEQKENQSIQNSPSKLQQTTRSLNNKHQQFQTNPKSIIISSFYEFQKRAQYFSKTHNFQNVWNIYKYFGLNINISQQQLEIFFKQYHKCLLKTVFKMFKNNLQHNKHSYKKLHNDRLVQKAFSVWVSSFNLFKQQKNKLLRADHFYQNRIKQKVYKILLSIVYSTKIFTKRQQFMQSKKICSIKKIAFKKWLSSYKIILSQRKIKEQKINEFNALINRFLMKISFKYIKSDSQQIDQRIKQCNRFWQNRLLKRIFKHFSNLLQNKNKYIQLYQRNQIQFKKRIFYKWFNLVKVKTSLLAVQRNIKKLILRNMYLPLIKKTLRLYLLNQEEQRNIVKQCFEQLKKQQLNQHLQRTSSSLQVQKNNYRSHCNSFVSCLRQNLIQNLREKKATQLKEKSNLLIQTIRVLSQKNVFINFKYAHSQTITKRQNDQKLKSIIQYNSLSLLIKNTTQDQSINQNASTLKKYIKLNSFRDFYHHLSQNLLEVKQRQLKLKINKKKYSQFVKQVSSKYNKLKQQQNISKAHFIKKTNQKVLLSLAQLVIGISQKSNKLDKMIKTSRKAEYLNVLKNKITRQIQCKNNSRHIQKKQLFSQLKLNSLFKQKRCQFETFLICKKQLIVNEKLNQHLRQNYQQQNLKRCQNKLRNKIFWFRFNQFFIQKLLQKKHVFMAYKFRALQLQQTIFNNWRFLALSNKRKSSKNKRDTAKLIMQQIAH